MTLGTTDRLAEPNRTDSTDAVGEHARFVILGLRSPFFSRQQEAIKSRGDFLFELGVGQQVAGELFTSKLIKRFVVIEGFDHVIAVRPNVARVVGVVTNGVGVSDNIQPADGHAFTVMW